MKKTKKRTQEMENASEVWIVPKSLQFVSTIF